MCKSASALFHAFTIPVCARLRLRRIPFGFYGRRIRGLFGGFLLLLLVLVDDAANVVRGMVYRATHDGPFRLQPEEVVRGEFVPLDEVARRAAKDSFCPDGLAVLAEYLRQGSLPHGST